MPPLALALALTAALVHATWNMLLARAPDKDAAISVGMVIGAALLLPIALLRWRMEPGVLPWLMLSSALELVYFVLLASAYRRADLSLVYPIARGLAPVLVLIGSVIFLAQLPTPERIAGVILVAVGVLLVRGLRSPADLRNVGLAVLIAAIIASYTLVDQQGLRYADPLPYLVVLVGIPGLIYMAAVSTRGGVARLRAAVTPSIVVGGICVVAGYGMVLAALTMAPASAVAAVRETSVVMATALAALVLHERVDRSRWLGSVVVVAGIVLVVAG